MNFARSHLSLSRINRRTFVAAALSLPLLATDSAWASSAPEVDWGGTVLDCHLHLRPGGGNAAHCDGSGVSHALLLARTGSSDVADVLGQRPGRFFWMASADVTRPDAVEILTEAVAAGALGFGELKSHVHADGPEMRRVYAAAAELGVPVLVHFQDVETRPGDSYNMGFRNFEAVLKAFPNTKFVGHANAFWANISNEPVFELNPRGPVTPGGITDELLSDYPNLFGDMAAWSGNNALSRDPEFTREFLSRHQDKLHFGSDCTCSDGKGGSSAPVPTATGSASRRAPPGCIGHNTLTLLKGATSPAVFRKLTWTNGLRTFGIRA
jgi:predicted TIM-barrel fold metal-dependent hydrolase